MAGRMAVVRWLLDSGPSIPWQVLRDLTDEPDEVVAAERSRVATEGCAATGAAVRRELCVRSTENAGSSRG
jgi:hypothetical protein